MRRFSTLVDYQPCDFIQSNQAPVKYQYIHFELSKLDMWSFPFVLLDDVGRFQNVLACVIMMNRRY